MWLLFGWSYDIYDYSNYYEYFVNSPDLIELGFVNILYNHINYLFFTNEWSFIDFRILYAFVCLSLLYIVAYKYSKLPNVVIILYFICVYFVDIVQMRNFIAYLICFFGFSFLYKSSFTKRLPYALLVALASTIHIATSFYLIFLCASTKKKLPLDKVFILTSIAALFLPKIIELLIKVLGLHIHDTLFYYSIYALIPGTAIILFNILIVSSFSYSKLFYYDRTSKLIGYSWKSDNIVYNCNVLLLFLMPFLYMSAVSIRLERNFIIINLIYIINKIARNHFRITNTQMILFLIYIVFNFIYFVYSRDVINGILNNNLAFE